MLCSFQLLPHVNIKYQEAQERLARAELICLMRKAGISSIPARTMIGGMVFFQFECTELQKGQLELFSRHSSIGLLAEETNGLLRPLLKTENAYLPRDIAEVLKYKGKTSTTFTRMMLNMALCSTTGSMKEIPLILDPMCGKGTTLFCAMEWGMEAAGIEINRNDLKQIMDYLDRYFQIHRLKYTVSQSSETVGKISVAAAEYTYSDSKQSFTEGNVRHLRLYAGDTACAGRLMKKRQADAIVADLPYGIQHAPQIERQAEPFDHLLVRAMPSWYDALRPGGILGLSYNTLTLKRKKILDAGISCGFSFMEGDPYDDLEHDVDQAVKRDAVFLKK